MKIKTNIFNTILLFSLCLFFLTGCGNQEVLDTYKTQMSDFFSSIALLDSDINAIDASAEDSHVQLLGYLDAIETEFTDLAALEVPDEFSSVADLADEAAENMTQAVALYHQLFENETYDSTTATVANEYYSRANVRLQYIITILNGELPEGENVTIVIEDEDEDTVPSQEETPASDVTETHGEIQTENPLAEE